MMPSRWSAAIEILRRRVDAVAADATDLREAAAERHACPSPMAEPDLDEVRRRILAVLRARRPARLRPLGEHEPG
jgi:hypothetical protein